MKSNVIWIDNHGKGFPDVIKEAHKVAVYEEIEEKKFLQIQLLTEEMLSMVLSFDEIQASFWFECRNGRCDMHLTTKTVLDKEKRNRLISSTSTGKNAAANTFLGRLRDRFENAMASGGNQTYDDLPAELKRDMSHSAREAHEWDGYERSIIRNVADDVKISIKNGLVDMTISKKYAQTNPRTERRLTHEEDAINVSRPGAVPVRGRLWRSLNRFAGRASLAARGRGLSRPGRYAL